MNIPEIAALVWIGGWAVTGLIFLRVRDTYGKGYRRHKDTEIITMLRVFNLHPQKFAVLMLVFWPAMLVSFLALLILPWAEKKLEEAEDAEDEES